MPTRSVGLLLSNAAKPVNGLSKTNIVQWFGGPLRVTATGAFEGASVEVMVCARLPHSGDRLEYNDPSKFSDADFTPIASMSAPGSKDLGNVNPCALAIRVINSADASRIKVTVA